MKKEEAITHIFLDTPVQVRRLTGMESIRRSIEGLLEDRFVLTSSTVFREFQRTVVGTYELVLGTILELEPDADALVRIADIDLALSESPHLRSDAQVKRVLLVTSAIGRKFSDCESVRCEVLAEFLKHEIDALRTWRFFEFGFVPKLVDIRTNGGYVDKVSCAVARQPLDPVKPGIKNMSCDSKTRNCGCRVFLAGNFADLCSLAGLFESLAPKVNSAVQAIVCMPRESLNGNQSLGQQLCWRLGDIIIALECPLQAHIFSYDTSFELLCPALRKSRFDPDTSQT